MPAGQAHPQVHPAQALVQAVLAAPRGVRPGGARRVAPGARTPRRPTCGCAAARRGRARPRPRRTGRSATPPGRAPASPPAAPRGRARRNRGPRAVPRARPAASAAAAGGSARSGSAGPPRPGPSRSQAALTCWPDPLPQAVDDLVRACSSSECSSSARSPALVTCCISPASCSASSARLGPRSRSRRTSQGSEVPCSSRVPPTTTSAASTSTSRYGVSLRDQEHRGQRHHAAHAGPGDHRRVAATAGTGRPRGPGADSAARQVGRREHPDRPEHHDRGQDRQAGPDQLPVVEAESPGVLDDHAGPAGRSAGRPSSPAGTRWCAS